MRNHVQIIRPRRLARTARLVPGAARTSKAVPSTAPVLTRDVSAAPVASSNQADPYLDYGRFLTPEGGILIAYKDIDKRLRFTLWRAFRWTAFTGFETWLLHLYSPVHGGRINLACLIVLAVINCLIVAKPIEIYRRIEIRPDCMILEGRDVFWLQLMENSWPAFEPDEDGALILCGIYGTRFVEYLAAHRFDDSDRMPEVFAAHVQEAMEKLWAPALGLGTVRPNAQVWQGG